MRGWDPVASQLQHFLRPTEGQAARSNVFRRQCSLGSDLTPSETRLPWELGKSSVRSSGLILDLGSPCQNSSKIIRMIEKSNDRPPSFDPLLSVKRAHLRWGRELPRAGLLQPHFCLPGVGGLAVLSCPFYPEDDDKWRFTLHS